jgi:hypothetical protein
VIGTRLAAALSLVLAVAAVALATAALMAALRDDDPQLGRLVQTRLVPSESDPVLFPLDGFYASTGDDGVLRALYVYPPGFFGHNRGCTVVWVPDAEGVTGTPGAFLDPCSGARFARDGTLIGGPGERGLDAFATQPGIEGVIVDTRTLYCGVASSLPAATAATAVIVVPRPTSGTLVASATVTEPPSPSPRSQGEREECERVSPDAD